MRVILSIITGIVLIVSVSGCTSKKGKEGNNTTRNVEVRTPGELVRFTQVDTLLYSYAGVSSMALPNGDLIFSSIEPFLLIKTNKEVSRLLAKTSTGPGPGEMLAFLNFDKGADGNLYAYDVALKKVVAFDEDLEVTSEFLVPNYDTRPISRVYALQDDMVILELGSVTPFKVDEKQTKAITQFHPETGEYGKVMVLNGDDKAPIGTVNANNIAGSSVIVPYGERQLIAPSSDGSTLYLFDTRTDIIAEVNAAFDTVHTINVSLPSELVNQRDIDSLKSDPNFSEDWEQIDPYLPELKAKASAMLISEKYIWIQTNLRGKYSQWQILSKEGKLIRKVYLPAKSMLTHISGHHLGVRLNDSEFALFEPVE